jgi:crotonobetaine/carnitine-CoA ligase
VAFVTLKADVASGIEERVIAHCRTALARFKVPREVCVLQELPRVTIGKVGKGALRKLLTSQKDHPATINSGETK